jgi:hypothetical protein
VLLVPFLKRRHAHASLKLQLKEKYEFNREANTCGKTEFVKSVVKEARIGPGTYLYDRARLLKNTSGSPSGFFYPGS